MHKMMEQFQAKMSEWGEWAKQNPEEWQKKMQWCNNKWKNFDGKHGWKEARAVCLRKPEQCLSIAPGMTEIIEIEVLNDTHWPWKSGCTLTLADEQPNMDMIPIDIFSVPIEQELRGKTSMTVSVPLTMAAHMIADDEKEYEVALTFRGPKGNAIGAPISLKMKCVLAAKQAPTQVDIYKLAIKLHE